VLSLKIQRKGCLIFILLFKREHTPRTRTCAVGNPDPPVLAHKSPCRHGGRASTPPEHPMLARSAARAGTGYCAGTGVRRAGTGVRRAGTSRAVTGRFRAGTGGGGSHTCGCGRLPQPTGHHRQTPDYKHSRTASPTAKKTETTRLST
jgi:hypothetical protein